MKNGLKSYRSWLAIIIAVLITGYFLLLILGSRSESLTTDYASTIVLPTGDTAFGGIFATNNIDQSLPYNQYKRLDDSLNQIRKRKEFVNKGTGGGGFSFGYLGLSALSLDGYPFPDLQNNFEQKLLRDSVDRLKGKRNAANSAQVDQHLKMIDKRILQLQTRLIDSLREAQKKNQVYYLTLAGFTLDYDTKFFISNNTYNLAYPKWDTTTAKGNSGHYERKQIPVRYKEDEKMIMIPISKKQYDIIEILLQTAPFLLIFLTVYIFIGIPIQLIINISRGKAFIPKNIRFFRLMSFALLTLVLLNIFLPYIINYFFRADIPSDFEFRRNAYNDPSSYLSQIFIAIALFIVSIAFQRGYKLQREQELTI